VVPRSTPGMSREQRRWPQLSAKRASNYDRE
jgi:hypothetical protein